jgi:predicted RND superfamily exporter protein
MQNHSATDPVPISWSLRYPKAVIALAGLLIAIAAMGLPNLKFQSDCRAFFMPDNPERLAYEELENTFVKRDSLIIVVAVEQGTWFTAARLDALKELTTKAWQLPYSSRVDSVTNFQHVVARDDNLSIRDLVDATRTLDEVKLEQIKAIALAEPLIVDQLLSRDATVATINVAITTPLNSGKQERMEVMAHARRLVAEARAAYPDFTILLSGQVTMNVTFREASIDDLQTIVPVSFTVMVLLLGLLLRSVAAICVTVTVFAGSVLFAMGVAGHLGLPISPPMAVAPTIILTIAIANCVHLFQSFNHAREAGLDKQAAVEEGLRVNVEPVCLAAITTALGFCR